MKTLNRFCMAAAVCAALLSCEKDAPSNDKNQDNVEKPENVTPEETWCERKGEGKEIYVPQEFRARNGFNNPKNKYCYARSYESENMIILWEADFGEDPSQAPKASMRFSVSDLAEQCEAFYTMFRDDLKFILPGSKADKYKMMIMVRYTSEGTVYGGSYDNVIGALWMEPSRMKDARLNAAAHELGHSFQFQLSIDSNSGFGSGGIYEMTSQWMLWQTNPHWFDDETYHWTEYMKQTHFAFMHPENMYHTCNLLEYWSYLHGQDFVANLWRAAKKSNDIVKIYKNLTGIDQDTFNDENWDHAARQINYDIPRIKEACSKYANRHSSTLGSADADGWKKISSSRVPQQYGYNGIKLTAPKAGEKVTVEFRGESESGIAGWRFGLVGTRKDGSIVYSEMGRAGAGVSVPGAKADEDSDESQAGEGAGENGEGGEAEEAGADESEAEAATYPSITLEADDDYTYLWLVVTAAPTEHKFSAESALASKPTTYPYAVRITTTKTE